jgi:nicotinamidase-related amidase
MSTRSEDIYEARGFGGRSGAGEHPALVVIDLCYGFTDPASPLACDCEGAVAATARLLDAARAGGHPVAFTTVQYDAAGREIAAAFIRKAPGLLTLEPGTRWPQIDERIAPAENEPVMPKRFASGVFGTSLGAMLAARGCDTVVVTGASTSGCVRATAVDALQHGYRVVVPREAVADRAEGAHQATLTDLDAKYGDVVGIDEAVAIFSR